MTTVSCNDSTEILTEKKVVVVPIVGAVVVIVVILVIYPQITSPTITANAALTINTTGERVWR